jgi:hypothetical protein
VVRLGRTRIAKPQVRGPYHRTPYGVASPWYAATPGDGGAARLGQARQELERRRLIVTEQEETGGRPRLVSRAVTR